MASGLLKCGVCLLLLVPTAISREAVRRELQAGVAGHAFDHLGAIGDQAEAAAASGASVIYVTGLGGLGYLGLPPAEELAVQRRATASYLDNARRRGIRLAIGYVCATSIVKLEAFARNWPPELRAQFGQPPAEWRQQDHAGSPLPSWYGGEYQPACMNNPDWRTYERFMVRQQLEAGCDGVFFDNPTVHPQGCYCSHCLEKFARFLRREGVLPRMASLPKTNSQVALRQLARRHSNAFLRFRCTIARDFLADMRDYARSLKRNALITANNSLNSPDVLYSQCRNYAYNIHELSRAEDFVVVEDMSSQPRTLSDGRVMEYGPTYRQLHAISRGKPVVAVTLAEADYHTPPHLVRLAMAEAAAHNASYLSWPTWPDRERERMISLIRPQADFLRRNASLLNDTRARRDLVLFLPFRNWLASDQCRASRLAAALTAANLQFEVVCEDDLWKALRGTKLLLAPSMADFTTNELRRLKGFIRAGGSIVTAEKVNWLKEVQAAIGEPAVAVSAHSTVRAVVRDQPHRTIVHLLNLDVRRLSSFEDTVTPVADLRVAVRVPLKQVRSVAALTADPAATSGPLEFAQSAKGRYKLVNLTIPRLEIATLLLID